jgi:hypothetical protein
MNNNISYNYDTFRHSLVANKTFEVLKGNENVASSLDNFIKACDSFSKLNAQECKTCFDIIYKSLLLSTINDNK